MLVYIILIVIIFLSSYFFRNKKKYFCIISGIALWSILAFRNISMGLNDTENMYYPFFQMILNMNFKEIIEYQFMNDKGFYFLMKIISILTDNYQICIAVLAMPFIYFIMKGIYKYSDNILISIVIFISLYYGYGFFLIRQVIAVSIIFYSYKYIKEKNFKKYIFMILIASLFHNTALIFLIAYPISNYIKFGYKNYIAMLISFFIGRYMFTDLLRLISKIDILNRYIYSINNGYYTIGDSLSIWGLIITVLLLILSNLLYRNSGQKNNDINILLNLSTLGSIFYCFTPVISEFYRISIYFSIFNVLLLSNALKYCNNKKIAYVIKFIIIILFIGYFFLRTVHNTNIYPYVFF